MKNFQNDCVKQVQMIIERDVIMKQQGIREMKSEIYILYAEESGRKSPREKSLATWMKSKEKEEKKNKIDARIPGNVRQCVRTRASSLAHVTGQPA